MSASDHVHVIGAGPAGLTAALELVRCGRSVEVLEASGAIGGLSRTARYKGYRFDIGGHRFFTKVAEVDRLWTEILGDEMLERPRLSRIHYGGQLFDYPLKPLNALRGLGAWESTRVAASYLKARVLPCREEQNFEQWVVNRFGRRLFQIFFKTYTEKVWGLPCNEISADWAAQRIKNLDLLSAVRNALSGNGRRNGEVISTLIDRFRYPRLGPGQMWERCVELIEEGGSQVRLRTPVTGLRHEDGRIRSIGVSNGDGARTEVGASEVLSSMPLRQLVENLDPAPPEEVLAAARSLQYRDFLTVVLIVDRAEVFPDNWIYIHSPDVQVGRIQNYKNWSPEMVPDPERTALGLEYFVNEGDELWRMSDEDLIELARRECDRLGLVRSEDVLDGTALRVRKAYPVYDDAYQKAVEVIRGWLDGIENLQQLGRNGQHRYNNQDHAMMTGLLAARNILGGEHDIWGVNVDDDYHESGEYKVNGVEERLVPRRTLVRPEECME